MQAQLVGLLYVLLGLLGFACNAATALMIITKRVFRLSAYTMMANVALADAVMTLVAGVVCGAMTLASGRLADSAPSPHLPPGLLNGSAAEGGPGLKRWVPR